MSRILIVEDSPTQAEQIRLMLEDAGFTVEAAADGQAALALVERAPPDAVVTDLEMPLMNGLQLVEEVRRTHPTVPVILMTAHGSEDIASLALRKGAASYVPKSYADLDLVPTLENILNLTRVQRHYQHALDCLTHAESQYLLENDPARIPLLIGHLEDTLARLKFCDDTELMRLGVALQEALLNAMYHGNLEVSSDLRQQDEKAYHDVIRQRRLEAPYRDRRVHFTARLSPAEAAFVIRDDGPGFDPSRLPDPTDPTNLERVGGRGLLLIRTFMDSVRHNERGNEVTLTKRRER
jgi:DNA-binding response OmpR family regulator